MDIRPYHKGIILKDDVKPLIGFNIVLSKYVLCERWYYSDVAKALGAEVTEYYDPHKNPILICPSAEGEKYQGAIKWGK